MTIRGKIEDGQTAIPESQRRCTDPKNLHPLIVRPPVSLCVEHEVQSHAYLLLAKITYNSGNTAHFRYTAGQLVSWDAWRPKSFLAS
jgi:hypothetical protein